MQYRLQTELNKLKDEKKDLQNERSSIINSLDIMESKNSSNKFIGINFKSSILEFIDENINIKEKLSAAIETIEEVKKHNKIYEENLNYEKNRNELVIISEKSIKAKLELAIDDINKLNKKSMRNDKDYREIIEKLNDQINEANYRNEELYKT